MLCGKMHQIRYCVIAAAYIYVRGEFYNEASNLQIAIGEVQLFSHCFFQIYCMSKWVKFVCISAVESFVDLFID